MGKHRQFMLWSLMLIGTVCQAAEPRVYKLMRFVEIPPNQNQVTVPLPVAPTRTPVQIVGVKAEAFVVTQNTAVGVAPQNIPVTGVQTILDLVSKNQRLFTRTVDNDAVEVWAPAPMEVTCIRPQNQPGDIWVLVVVTVKWPQ